jgi:hypothetical protein
MRVLTDWTLNGITSPDSTSLGAESIPLDVDKPDSDRQWAVTAYALAFGSLPLVGGRLGVMLPTASF